MATAARKRRATTARYRLLQRAWVRLAPQNADTLLSSSDCPNCTVRNLERNPFLSNTDDCRCVLLISADAFPEEKGIIQSQIHSRNTTPLLDHWRRTHDKQGELQSNKTRTKQNDLPKFRHQHG